MIESVLLQVSTVDLVRGIVPVDPISTLLVVVGGLISVVSVLGPGYLGLQAAIDGVTPELLG